MKVFQINTVYNSGSTGRIAADIKHSLEAKGHECFVAYGRGSSTETNTECISNKMDLYAHALLTRFTDKTGLYSKRSTKKLIQKIEEFQPDVIHLHNIHGYYVNYVMLFSFLKKYGKPVVWTLHDCWSFTGHCSFFDYAKCEKWKDACKDCSCYNQYPKSFVDGSKMNFVQKKKAFTSLDDVTIVTPSQWLADSVSESFLAKYPIKVINNGIDINVFKPTTGNTREKYQLGDKKIVLGVASTWEKRKGLADFVELSKVLSDDYRIVLVGLNKKQIQELPREIVGIERTDNINELAELYTEADVYFNASVEETMGLTTVEALACGTPVVTYDRTAVPEFVPEVGGIVVKGQDVQAVKQAIEKLSESQFDTLAEECASKYNKADKYEEYLNLYEQVLKRAK